MKGVVFNLLEEVVSTERGEEAWDDLLDEAGLAGIYTSLGSYPDAEMERLVRAASGRLAIPENDVWHWFGRRAMPLLAKAYPAFFEAHESVRPFIRSVNSIIHPEVRKLYAGAHCPDFDFEDAPDGALLMGYHSPRRLCGLAQGFVEGAAAYYGETVAVTHLECMHRGDPKCLIRVFWP